MPKTFKNYKILQSPHRKVFQACLVPKFFCIQSPPIDFSRQTMCAFCLKMLHFYCARKSLKLPFPIKIKLVKTMFPSLSTIQYEKLEALLKTVNDYG